MRLVTRATGNRRSRRDGAGENAAAGGGGRKNVAAVTVGAESLRAAHRVASLFRLSAGL